MTSLRAFTKIEVAGNDYIVVVDEGSEIDLTSELVAQVCDRNRGIGALGLIRLTRNESLSDDVAPWFVDARNADGTIADLRGDEVIAAIELLSTTAAVPTRVAMRWGELQVRRAGDAVSVELGPWRLSGGEPLVSAQGLNVARPRLGIELASPHVVVALASSDELTQLDLTHRPEVDPAPHGDATVVFIVPGDPLVQDGCGRLLMRVVDRVVGEVPGSTVAAGAAALAVRYWAGSGAPREWDVASQFGVTQVSIALTEQGERVRVAAVGRRVFSGEIYS